MRVKLAVEVSGTRDGVKWPKIGTEMDLPENEALSMVRAGTAVVVDESDKPGPSVDVPDDVDEASEKFIPETGRHEPVSLEVLPEDDRRPNMNVVGLADDGSIGTGPVTTENGPVRRAQSKPKTVPAKKPTPSTGD